MSFVFDARRLLAVRRGYPVDFLSIAVPNIDVKVHLAFPTHLSEPLQTLRCGERFSHYFKHSHRVLELGRRIGILI